MYIEKVNQPVVSAIRYVQLSHFCQQRALPDRVEGFTVVYCNNTAALRIAYYSDVSLEWFV